MPPASGPIRRLAGAAVRGAAAVTDKDVRRHPRSLKILPISQTDPKVVSTHDRPAAQAASGNGL
jgi:hypothetical protein